MFSFLALLPLLTLTAAAPQARSCVGTIASLSDVSAAVECSTINIQSFTVPSGETFSLSLIDGTIVNVVGDIEFGSASWKGPLFYVKGNDITFNGNGKTWDGNGPSLWDGQGGNGGVAKPDPMMKVAISGTFCDVKVINSPQAAFAINPAGPLTISGCTVDNSAGNAPNSKSGGKPAGHNTDGFDIDGDNVIIKGCTVINQDDCIAIKAGKNMTFEDNHCQDGHGMSIGSIESNAIVDSILFRGNVILNSVQAFRIKTDQSASNSQVNGITYIGNTATNCTNYGVIFDQSYPATLGTPGNGVTISNINFIDEETEVSVATGAKRVAVNCGTNSCTGSWKWNQLHTSGGQAGQMKNAAVITDYSSSP